LRLVPNPSGGQRQQAQRESRGRAKAHAEAAVAGLLKRAAWSTSFSPTLKDLEEVRGLVRGAVRAALCEAPPPMTEFEKAAGKPLAFHGRTNPFSASFEQKALFFAEQVEPAAWGKVETRLGAWAKWRTFVTFCLIEGVVEQAMPASEAALKAFATQLFLLGYSGVAFTGFFEAIIMRHRRYRVPLPVEDRTIRRWCETA